MPRKDVSDLRGDLVRRTGRRDVGSLGL